MVSSVKKSSNQKKTIEEEIERSIISNRRKKEAFEHLAKALMKKIDGVATENNLHNKQSK